MAAHSLLDMKDIELIIVMVEQDFGFRRSPYA